MNILLWILQIVGAVVFGASGVMKVFLFDKVSGDVPSFGALPRSTWQKLGVVELVCTGGLVVPSVLGAMPWITVVAAVVLALETLVFVWVHTRYREVGAIVFSVGLGLVMAFVAYGRSVLAPLG